MAIAISIFDEDRDRDRDLNFDDRAHALNISLLCLFQNVRNVPKKVLCLL